MPAAASPTAFVFDRARVLTGGDPPLAEALAIRGGRVVAVGSSAACAAAAAGAAIHDLGGRTVLPGLIDAHLHWPSLALMRQRLRLDAAQTLAEALAAVATAAAGARGGAGGWVIGRGWDHSLWGRWPGRRDLDAVCPDRPAMLTRKDGHAAWLNSTALRAAGITAGTPDPEGGAIARNADGEPTGILLETAIDLARRVVPSPTRDERRSAIVDAWPDAWRVGLTGVHEMGFPGVDFFDDLVDLRAAGGLGLRVVWYGLQDAFDTMLARGWRSGTGDAWLRVGGLKLFLDGTLGSQTADMLAPYEGQPANRGIATMAFEDVCDWVDRAAAAGLATAMHAIGDAANRKALDAFERVRQARPEASGLRQRIEHCQIVDPADHGRFKSIGVVASMQPIHATSDMRVADALWGERSAHAYAWRALAAAGARLAFGSDAPIETLSPIAGLHAAVTRQDPTGRPVGGWRAGEAVSVAAALRAYTLGAAWTGGTDHLVGSLEVGKCADLIVVDRDPFDMPAAELGALRVLATMIDGAWVWQADDVDLPGPARPVSGA